MLYFSRNLGWRLFFPLEPFFFQFHLGCVIYISVSSFPLAILPLPLGSKSSPFLKTEGKYSFGFGVIIIFKFLPHLHCIAASHHLSIISFYVPEEPFLSGLVSFARSTSRTFGNCHFVDILPDLLNVTFLLTSPFAPIPCRLFIYS